MIYIINGGFEAGAAVWSGVNQTWEIIEDAANAHSGTWVGVRRGLNGPESTLQAPLIACREGDTLVASVYIKRSGSDGAGAIRVSLRDQHNAEVQGVVGNDVTETFYTRSSVRITVPADVRLFRVELVGTNQDGTDIYFDDVVLEVLRDSDTAALIAADPVLDSPAVLGRSRVATQYTDSPRFLAWLAALLRPGVNLRDVLLDITLQSDLNVARGYNLDVIGEIVGVNRIVPEAIAFEFFGFQGLGLSAPFGELGQLTYGARFRELSESGFASTVLGDVEFRTLIKAKILRNHTKGTPEDIIRGLSFLFGSEGMMIEDNGGMEIAVIAGRQLTAVEIAILDKIDILPRPAAVKINRRMMYIPGNYFGFEGQPKARGFGEEGELDIGGLLAEEF